MQEKVAVSTNMAQKFADLHNMPLFETSAKDESESDHVEAIFMTLAHKLKNAKPMMPHMVGFRDSQTISVRRQQQEDSGCPCWNVALDDDD